MDCCHLFPLPRLKGSNWSYCSDLLRPVNCNYVGAMTKSLLQATCESLFNCSFVAIWQCLLILLKHFKFCLSCRFARAMKGKCFSQDCDATIQGSMYEGAVSDHCLCNPFLYGFLFAFKSCNQGVRLQIVFKS